MLSIQVDTSNLELDIHNINLSFLQAFWNEVSYYVRLLIDAVRLLDTLKYVIFSSFSLRKQC